MLQRYLNDGTAIAFLVSGASAPLYPLWEGLVAELIDLASDALDDDRAKTYQQMVATNPDTVVELIRQELGPLVFRETLR